MKTPTNESGSDDSDLDDLDDDEISLGSLDEEDFGDEMGEEGGTFVNDEDDDEEGEEDAVVSDLHLCLNLETCT